MGYGSMWSYQYDCLVEGLETADVKDSGGTVVG